MPSPDKRFTGSSLTSFEPVSENTVCETVQNSAPKACEPDPMPTSLLIECLDIVLPILTQTDNDSLIPGIFQQIHKSALVIPLLKKKPTLDHNGL